MSIKYIHVTLIIASILLSLGFALWTMAHEYMSCAFVSLFIAAGLLVYCVQFIKKMKSL